MSLATLAAEARAAGLPEVAVEIEKVDRDHLFWSPDLRATRLAAIAEALLNMGASRSLVARFQQAAK